MLKKIVAILVIALLAITTTIPAFAEASYVLNCTLDKTSFAFSESVTGVGYLLSNGLGDSGQRVAAVIESADGLQRKMVKEFVVDADGKFVIKMEVNNSLSIGSYVLKLSARNGIVIKSVPFTIILGGTTGPVTPPPVTPPPVTPPPVTPTVPPTTPGTQNGNTVTAPAPSYDAAKGSASTNVDAKLLDAALNASTGDVKKAEVTVPEVAGAKEYSIGIDAPYVTSAQTAATSVIEVKTKLAVVSVPNNMFSTDTMGQGKKVDLVVAKADTTGLSEALKTQIGNKPVFEFNVQVDGQKKEWSNPNAPVTISFDYTPTAEELANPDSIVVWYVDGNGNVVTISNAKYNQATGKLTFSTTHFSKYAVAYVKKSFTDLGNYASWAAKDINLVTAKDILKSKSNTTFEPGVEITRGDFIYGLVRALNLSTKIDGNFSDVKTSDYYYNELAIAKKLGIASGVGNNEYKPTDKITRQDMATLIDRALKLTKKQGKTEADLSKFGDSNGISAYAVSSVKAMVADGILMGDGKNINPKGNTTRGETAAILSRIFKK